MRKLGAFVVMSLDGLMLAAVTPGLAFGTPGTPLEIELTSSSLATSDFGDARLGGTEYGVLIRGPSMRAGASEFRWALDYAYQRYEYQGLATRNRDLHRLELPLSWHGNAAHAWTIELQPVIATSSNVFKDIWSRGSSDDLMWHGQAIVERAPGGAGWGWRLGAVHDDAFGRDTIYPVVALLRQHNGARLEVGWPISRAMLDVGRSMELGGEVAPAGARWHVVSDERDGASFDYEVRAWRAGAIVRWRPAGGFVLRTHIGLEFERRHRLEDDTGAIVNRAVDEATYVELSAGYRW